MAEFEVFRRKIYLRGKNKISKLTLSSAGLGGEVEEEIVGINSGTSGFKSVDFKGQDSGSYKERI